MKKRNNSLAIVAYVTLLLLIPRCMNENSKDGIKLLGVSLGDELSDSFEIVKKMDYPYLRARLVNDHRLQVSLIDSVVYSIEFYKLSTQEFKDLFSETKSLFKNTRPISNKDGYPYLEDFEREFYIWIDTVSGLNVRFEKDINGQWFVYEYNSKLTDSISKRLGIRNFREYNYFKSFNIDSVK